MKKILIFIFPLILLGCQAKKEENLSQIVFSEKQAYEILLKHFSDNEQALKNLQQDGVDLKKTDKISVIAGEGFRFEFKRGNKRRMDLFGPYVISVLFNGKIRKFGNL